jgi:hypothetical protein
MVGREEWKEISGYEGRYMVSNLGNVVSCERYVKVGGGGQRLVKEKILKQTKCPGGYNEVNLWKDNSRKMFLVHRLVAEAFLENKNKLPEVNHKDENKENNCVENLEWCTSKYNANYGTRNKRMVKQKSLKPVVMLDVNGIELKRFASLGDASRETGFGISSIIRVCKGRQKTSMGYKWRYIG